MKITITFVIFSLFLDNFYVESDPIERCNKTGLQECLQDFVQAAFSGSRSENCSSPSTESSCVAEHVRNCKSHLGTTLSPVFTAYIELLDRIHEKSCKNQAEIQSCDLSDAKSCIADFMVVMASGHLGSVCRQSTTVLNCLSPTLERCSGLPRYLVALVTDEIQLTADFWCSSRACRVDVASQCIDDAMDIFDYPSAIEMQSNLICRDLKSSLACAINNTEMCPQNTIPVGLSVAFNQISQFSSAYCGVNPVTEVMTSTVPRDLVAPLYLAALTSNDWTSEKDICRIYNATIKLAASERISFGSDVESLLQWQQYLSITLDKLSDTCLNNDTLNCDWITVLANEAPTCDPAKAEKCVDLVLLSKLTVEVNLRRTSWESTCSVAYNMIACAQYHTGSCLTADLSSVMEQTQQIENLVGYECSQIGADDTQGACDIENHRCESARAVHECIMFGYGLEDRCQEKDKIFSCFREHLDHCDSVQRVPAQFYMEWLLNTCSHNFTLLADDIYTGISRCKLQYGYNLYNRILGYSDFNTVVCSVTTLYRQCLADQFIPSVVAMYMQEVEDFYSAIQLTVCNITRPGSDLSAVSEAEDCLLSESASEVTLSLEFYSNFPFMSLEDQEVVCRTYPSFKDIWASRALSCSTSRQSVIADAVAYFDNIHNALCSISRPDVERSCDVTTIQMCLEDFGAFTYFAKENSDVCRKVEETFDCLIENTRGCDDVIHDALLQEVMSVKSLLGNITCQKPKWCATDNSTDWFPWQQEICSDWGQCLLFDWISCVDQYNLYSCQFYTEGVACIEEKLSSCSPLQILLAKSEMEQWILQNSPNCNFVPNDPASITPVYKNMFECSNYISQSQDVSKQGLCSVINTYLACLTSTDPSDVPYVWRGILGRNGQLWRKRLYFDCQLSSANTFVVGQGFNPDNITGGACRVESQYCLRALTSLAVTYSHLIPLSERFQLMCERSDLQYMCVLSEASGCINPVDRYLLTSAEWVREGFDNAGTCSDDYSTRRECNPDTAMECVAELGLALINDLESVSVDTVCSKLQSTSMCVNLQTSSCDYFTRSQVAKTFNQISAIIKSVCSPTPIMPATTSCLQEGEATQCDLEEFLMCIVPVQAMLLHPNSTWEQICRPIPEMKTCIHRSSSGCDDVTMRSVYQRLHRLSHRLNDQCPQFYCDECMARSCLVNMQRNLQYQNASLCGVISETKRCLYEHAGYCDQTVRDNLLREMTLLGGQDAYLCEITLPSCLQTFMMSALQISGYTPLMNVSSQNGYLLGQLCNEANAAYYCVSQHLTSIETQKLHVINSTLEKIGNIVYRKCQGSQLQCYSCVNATSNEECNQRNAQTCSADMQMCGTVFTGTALYKGCVKPGLCQSGCNGTMCSMCCGTSLCNQPWNDVVIEPASCQPEAAMYCGFQLLSSLVQNETANCMNLQASLNCMIQSTQSCMSPQSMTLGILARDLLTRDIMSSCIEDSPVCGCGQCTSMLLLSVVSSPYGDVDKFCRMVFDMYNRTLLEMNLTNCSISDIQTTAYNLQLTAYMIQGICSIQVFDNTSCNYNGKMYSHGASFMAEDGCNYCSCDRGAVACTLMYCPPDDRPQCPDIDQDQVGTCVEMCFTDYDCNSGQVCCSNGCGHVCTQPKQQGAGNCNYGNKTYHTGDSFSATDGCNFCFCYDEIVSCTEMYCPSGGETCRYNGVLYQDGDTFQDEDGCNSCTCNNGNVACTYMYCPPDNNKCPIVDRNHAGVCVELCSADTDCTDGQLCCSNGCGHVCTNVESEGSGECKYDGVTYQTGQSFTASDGCNTCFCTNGLVGCTKMYCPTEGTCDIQGVQTCINDAALPYLMLRASTVNARQICMSAAGLLKCVEAKVNQCPSQILDIIRSAVWSNLNTVQSVCNINDIIYLLTYHGEHTNYTVPAITGKCSLQKGVECFRVLDDSNTCSSYQSMIDCVYNFSSDCLSIDAVPVLFELKAHVEEKLSDCDLVIPQQNMDPFYPIANCMTEFGASVNSELTLTYLRHGRLDGFCNTISALTECLHNISNIQPAGKLFVSNLVSSLANLVQLCNDWGDGSTQELVTCHHCQGFTDMEKCDSMPVYECQQNQICATAMQLDANSGVAMVTKGCADYAWCQMSHGCNPYFMSCVTCCHGDRCNSADSTTTNITMTTDSWRTTIMKQTKDWRTTSLPHTNSYDSCHIDRISAVLTAHVLRLMTFSNLPAYDRQFVCKNDFVEFDSMFDHLDENCPENINAHVRKLIERLHDWKSDVCDENTIDARCIEAVQCVSDVGNFSNKNSTCRSISKSLDCLKTHYSYCSSQGQMSINSTRQILSHMNYVICEPNKLFRGPEDIDCVSIETTDVTSAKCDVNMTMECAAHIEKAYVNPFMTQDDFCRVGKRGLVCIRDNTYNCSMETIAALSPKTMQLIQAISQSCPDALCPAEDKCNLEPAWQCLRSLEAEFSEKLNDGSFNRSVCTSIARTHHCVLNATQNCNIARTQRLFHQFSAITFLAGSWCNEQPISFHQCFDNFHRGVDRLMNLTEQFITQILRSNLQNELLQHLLYKDFDDIDTAKGMSLLRLDISLFKYFSNETVNLPGVVGYLFKNRNNLDEINLPELHQFLSQLTFALQQTNDGDGDAGGAGLNLPGGGSSGGQDSNTCNEYNGINLPGNNFDPSDNGDFGYGLNLPGGYGSLMSIDVHKHIEQIITILFQSNANTASEVTDKILNSFDIKLMDVPYMIDERSLIEYTHYQSHLCSGIHHSVDCAYGSLHNLLMTSSKKQEFLSTTTLRLLDELSYDMCQELKCYSCNELHSNEECNAQPLATCGPLQVCQSRYTGTHFYKGCVSTLTCQQECLEGEGQCYCCEGNQCNQDAVPLSGDGKCQIQSAVDAAIELLAYSTSESYMEDGALIRKAAIEMIGATDNCHGKFQKNFRNEGQRIMLLFEAESCARSFMSNKCDIEGLHMLTHMISASFSTIASTEAVCSLYDKVLHEVTSEISVGGCCDRASVETLIDIFHLVHPICKEANIEQLCKANVHPACSDLLPESTNSSRSSRMASKNSTYKDADSLNHMCSKFMYHVNNETNRSKTSETEIKIECKVTDALNECFGDFGDPVDCSDAVLDRMLLCVQNLTYDCLPMQSLPVMLIQERLYHHCDKNMNSTQLSDSEENREPYQCIKELATVNVSVEVENTLVLSLCDAVVSANDCLNAKQVRDNRLQNLYFDGVQDKMNRFNSVICTNDLKNETAMIKRNNTCEAELLDETFNYLTLVITSPFALMNDICRYTSEIEELVRNMSSCSDSISSITAWIHNEVKEMCDANMAENLCHRPICDVPMATDLLEQLGYFLLANGFDDFVFCQKTANVLQGVKCVTQDCEEDLTSVTNNIMYIKSVVGSRCPLLTEELFCADRTVDHGRNTSTGNEMRYSNANNNKNSNRNNNENSNNGNNNINATERNRESEICDVMAAKLCVYSVTFPSSDDGLYCSKMVPIVRKLSDCVTENLIGCAYNDLRNAAMYYTNLFLKRGPVCYTDFTTSLLAQLSEVDQCIPPQCSHEMAYDCFSHFKYEEGKRCGNFEDVKQCVYYATEGCNEIQQYVLMSSLATLAETKNVPEECWLGVKLSLNDSSASLTACVNDFYDHVSEVQEGNVTGSSTCRIMRSLMTCIESTIEQADMPSLMKESAKHVLFVTKPSIETFCKHTATVNTSKAETVDEEKGNSKDTCDIQRVHFCMKISTSNVLMSSTFSMEGKQFVCDHLSEWRSCLQKTLSDCSDDGITSPYFSIYSLIEVIAQLSGVCSPAPVTCSPEIAMECVSSLAHAISQRPQQQDTCWTLQRTKLCIRQTMRGCDSFTWQAFQRTYAPFACKGHALCPTAIHVFDYTTDTPQPCIDLKEVVVHSGTCSPSTALKCLQDFYLDVLDPNKATRNATCGKYPAALTCFFNNINACEDDMVVLLAMYYLPSVSDGMDIHCETKLEHNCPIDGEHGCNLKQMEECVAAFKNVANSGNLQEQCLGYETAKYCYEMSTMACPRISRLYAKAKFMASTSTWVDNREFFCDGIEQCTYNYIMYFKSIISSMYNQVSDSDDDRRILETKSIKKSDPTILYQCRRRLEELSCIQTRLKMLPEDIAEFIDELLLQVDSTFSDICAIQTGLILEIEGCKQTCMQCLLNKTRSQSELALLLSFVVDTVNESAEQLMFSSSRFCRVISQLHMSGDGLNESCLADPQSQRWQANHTTEAASLFDKYCARPCNETQAAYCIEQFKSDILRLNKEEICLSFNETLKCLEDSVTSCEANVTRFYVNEAEKYFTDTEIVCYTMPTFEVSYNTSEMVIVEGGISQQGSISVSMTTPVMSSCNGNNCYIEIFISMEQPATECSSGSEIQQILMDSCMFVFDASNTDETHEFNFYPRVDHKTEPSTNVTVNVVGQLWEDGLLATGDTLASVTLMLEDRDTAGVCYLISEPTIRTFDSLLYYSFYQGEYILYKHDTIPERVHVGFQPCRSGSSIPCPCVIMVLSGDDTFILDRCRRFGERNHALEFTFYKNNDLTEKTKVYTLTNRDFFQFVLPSGTIVNVRSGRFLLDAWIKPSALDFGQTSGLCGTYDGDMENDLTMSDNAVEPLDKAFRWRDYLLPHKFVKSWRLENTLFGGVSESESPLPSDILGQKCVCVNSTCMPMDIVETCDFIIGEDITTELELYTQIIENENRRKRQTDDIWNTIDFNPEDPDDQFPTWPTDIGFTEINATQICESALRNHASWDICSVAIDTASIISSCVTEILLTDTDEFVKGYAEDMKVQCKLAVLADPTISSLLNQTQDDLVSFLLTLTCINDCSNHGQCVNDICLCDTGYNGVDCSVSADSAPVIASLSEYIYSGTADSGLTVISRQVTVYGSGFQNSASLTCHLEQVKVSNNGYISSDVISSSSGTFLTSETIQCDLTGSLPLTGVLVSVSNNRVNRSNDVLYIFQDEVCYNCDPALQVCNLQPTSCMIDGQCYRAGTYNPTDQCLVCDPVTNVWTFKPSFSCTTTSKSTSISSSPSSVSRKLSTVSSSQKTNTNPSGSTSMSSTTSPKSPSSTPSKTTPASTPAQISSTLSGQGGESSDQDTFNIVIITGACVGVLIIIVTVIFACRLRRSDKKASETGSSTNSTESPIRKGQSNPGYSSGEPRQIAGDPVIQPRRVTEVYSANFNTEGLEGRSGAPAMYRDDPGLQAVNIDFFDENRGRGASTNMPTRSRLVNDDAVYDNARFERQYTIPRPYVDPSPAGLYPEVRRQTIDAEYDNAAAITQGPNTDRRDAPMPDYYEDDGAYTITKM